jgi:hypothetical protein
VLLISGPAPICDSRSAAVSAIHGCANCSVGGPTRSPRWPSPPKLRA